MTQLAEIPGFPYYVVSSDGEVINKQTDEILTARANRQGLLMVGILDEDRRQKTRSLAKLVAEAFLEPHGNPAFDTPCHIDGDRFDCSAENLIYRPRWFVVKYHAQFYRPEKSGRPVYCHDTDDEFDRPMDAAKEYVMLEEQVIWGSETGEPTFPHGFEFSYL